MKKNLYAIVIACLVLIMGVTFTYALLQSSSAQAKTALDGYVIVEDSNSAAPTNAAQNVTLHYFKEGTKLKSVYGNKVSFTNTSGSTITVSDDHFLFYTDGSIASMKDGVLLVIDEESGLGTYYDVPSFTPLNKTASGFLLDNAGSPISVDEAIWKIDEDKYLVLGDTITADLSESTHLSYSEHVEFSYLDEGVLEVRNEDGTYHSIANQSVATLGASTILNLAEKTLEFPGLEEPLSLSSMVINASTNQKIASSGIGIIPKFDVTTIDGLDGANGVAGEDGQSGLDGVEGVIAVNGQAGIRGSDGTVGNQGNTSDEIAETLTNLPQFGVTEWELSSSKLHAKLSITDDDGLISEKPTYTVTRVDNGQTVLQGELDGTTAPIFEVQNLEPGVQYRLSVFAIYNIGQTSYNREFINKLFTTDDLGVTLNIDHVTLNSFNVNIDANSNTTSVSLQLYNSNYEEMGTEKTITSFPGTLVYNSQSNILSNQQYYVRITKAAVGGVEYSDKEINKKYYPVKTLQEQVDVGGITVYADKRNNQFVVNMTNSQKLTVANGFVKVTYDIYRKNGDVLVATATSSTNQAVNFPVKTACTATEKENSLCKGVNYYIKASVYFNDNQSEIIYYAQYDDISMDGEQFPTMTFANNTNEAPESETQFNQIIGAISINLNNCDLDSTKTLTVSYTNSIGETKESDVYPVTGLTRSGEIVTINVSKTGLRSNETYTIAVTGPVDIGDGNGFQEVLIGSVVAKTKTPTSVLAQWNSASDPNKALAIQLRLADTTVGSQSVDASFEMKTAKTMRLSLYEGTSIEDGASPKAVASISTEDTDLYQSDFYYKYSEKTATATSENYLTITESTFGFTASELSATSYVVKVESLSDYTDYSDNVIGVVNMVSPAITKTHTAPPLPAHPEQAITTTSIYNYQLTNKEPAFKSDAVFGIKATPEFNNINQDAKNIIYTVYDAENYDLKNVDYSKLTKLASVSLDFGNGLSTAPIMNIIFQENITNPTESVNAGQQYNVYQNAFTYYDENGNVVSGNESNYYLSRGRKYVIQFQVNMTLNGEDYLYPDDDTSLSEGEDYRLLSTVLDLPFYVPSLQLLPNIIDKEQISYFVNFDDPDDTIKTTTNLTDKVLKVTKGTSDISEAVIVTTEDGTKNIVTAFTNPSGSFNYRIGAEYYRYVKSYSDAIREKTIVNFAYNSTDFETVSDLVLNYKVENDVLGEMYKITFYEPDLALNSLNQLNKIGAFEIHTIKDGKESTKAIYKSFDGANENTGYYTNLSYADLATFKSENNGEWDSIRIYAYLSNGQEGFGLLQDNLSGLVDRTKLFSIRTMSTSSEAKYVYLTDTRGTLGTNSIGANSIFYQRYGYTDSDLIHSEATYQLVSPLYGGTIAINVNTNVQGNGFFSTSQQVLMVPQAMSRNQMSCSDAGGGVISGSDFPLEDGLPQSAPTVSLNEGTSNQQIKVGVTSVEIPIRIGGEKSVIKDKKVYIDLYNLNDDITTTDPIGTYPCVADSTWNLTDDTWAGKVKIEDLLAGANYKFLIHYVDKDGKVQSFFDIDRHQMGIVYVFSTISTFDSSLGDFTLSATSYSVKELTSTIQLGQVYGFSMHVKVFEGENNTSGTPILDSTNDLNHRISWDSISTSTNLHIQWNPGSKLQVGKTYTVLVECLARNAEGAYTIQLSSCSKSFKIPMLKYPSFGYTSVPFVNDGEYGLTYRISISDLDKSIVTSSTQQNKGIYIKVFDESGTDITEKAKDSAQNSLVGTLLPIASTTGSTVYYINLNGLNAGEKYTLKVYGQVDRSNTGSLSVGEYGSLSEERVLLSVVGTALNSTGIELGTVQAVAQDTGKDKIRITFNDAVGLDKIARVQYTVFDSNGNAINNLADQAFTALHSTIGYDYINLSDFALVEKGSYTIALIYYDASGNSITTSQLQYNYD